MTHSPFCLVCFVRNLSKNPLQGSIPESFGVMQSIQIMYSYLPPTPPLFSSQHSTKGDEFQEIENLKNNKIVLTHTPMSVCATFRIVQRYEWNWFEWSHPRLFHFPLKPHLPVRSPHRRMHKCTCGITARLGLPLSTFQTFYRHEIVEHRTLNIEHRT